MGEGGAVIVPDDLVVPRGETCYLEGTVVQGDVRVGPDADLVVEGGSIEGMVTVGVNAYRETSDVSGSVNARRSFYADAYDTFIDGEFRAVGSENGSAVCSSAIQGLGHFLNNMVGVQLGGDGPLVDCEGSNFWGSDVYVTTGGVSIDDNIIHGSLYLEDNDPIAQLGDGNLVRGEVVGDFEPMPDMEMSALEEPACADLGGGARCVRPGPRRCAPRRGQGCGRGRGSGLVTHP